MLVVLLTSCALIISSVVVHYNALVQLARFLASRDYHKRYWVAASVLILLLAHVIEIELFAAGFFLLEEVGDYGRLVGEFKEGFSDYSYYSFVVYTSLGFGDITPTRELRLLTGLETLTGLILIAWSASFIFMQMHRFWSEDHGP